MSVRNHACETHVEHVSSFSRAWLALAIVVASHLTACATVAPRVPMPLATARPLPFAPPDENDPPCRFRYSVVSRGAAPTRQPVDPENERMRGFDGNPIEIVSGDERYRLIAEQQTRDSDDRTWRIERESGPPVPIGYGSFGNPPSFATDGKGAIVVHSPGRYPEPERSVIVTPTKTLTVGLEFVGDDLELDRVRDGWLVSWRYGGTLMIVPVDDAGVALRSVERGGAFGKVIALDVDDVPLIAVTTREGLRFGPVDRPDDWVVIDRVGGLAAHEVPVAMVAGADDVWIVADVDWQSDHFASGPPETRFIHVARDGTEIGRVHVRSDSWQPLRVEDVRVEDGELRAAIVRSYRPDPWEAIAIVDAPPCTAPPRGSCDAWAEERDVPEEEFARRRGVDPAFAERIRGIVPDGDAVVAGPVVVDDHGAFVTIGDDRSRIVLHGLRGGVDDWNATVATEPTLGGLDLVAVDESLVGCATTREGLTLFDATTSWRVANGAFEGCALHRSQEHLVVGTSTIVGESSAGTDTVSELFVLSADGRQLVARHTELVEGHAVRFLSDDDGTWVLYRQSATFDVLRLDARDRPTGPPRRLARLWFFPRIEFAVTPHGPQLEWWRWDAHGVVPLCWDEPEER